MKPYPKYKPSDIQWLGDIPEHWEVKKLKYVVDFFNNIRVPLSSEERGKMDERIYDYYGASGIIDKVENYLFDGKYILIGEDGANLLTRNTALAFIAEGQFWVNNHAHIIKPKDGDIIFFENLLENFDYTTFVTGSAQPKLTLDNLQNIELPIPPLPEQTAIAQFLDQKTAQIDTLIAQKQRLITLLKEERMAFINEILSDESFPLKKLKYVVDKIGSGVTPSGGANVYQLSGIPLLRSQNVYFDGLRLDDVAFISEKIHDGMKNSKVFEGDVLLNITGGSIGRCYFVDENLGEANVNQHVCIIRPSKEVITKYLYFLLSSESGQKQIDEYQTGANREGLNFEQLKNFLFPFPSLKTQQKIVESIETTTGKIDATLAKIVQEIELLKEYRVALISEVVTGKVSVV